jgi:hypothetical protein
MHGLQSISNRALPPIKSVDQILATLRVCLEQLSGEASQGAATLALDLTSALNQEITPCPQGFQTVQACEKRLLALEDRPGLMCDHGTDHPLLVTEVVVELRGAYSGRILYVLPAGACHAARIHQHRRGFDDPFAGG